MSPYTIYQLATMKPRGMTWRRWLRLNRIVRRALAARRAELAERASLSDR